MADTTEDEQQDIFYVCEKTLNTVKEKLTKNEDIGEELVNQLTLPEKVPDDEMMIPVDMRGVGEEFDDVEQMLEKLGPKGTAEAFVKAYDFFEKNKEKLPESERPPKMTAAEWRKVLDEERFMEDGEEELLGFEGEEEEDLEDDGEGEDDGEVKEPDAKKAKTE
ncbi:unnamed protein product [Cladocopium goreaui]|uniref:Uncharacterized protein n=1 Tax=Cladocopium goreaui TaxID=2562237 RepID=A0A9P1FHU9_9DINO|nr:unnamed protein product [Cladocopium goreaui]|mmetsp:Transcript_60808/g.123316  ORF Transcript_60808/g.123316 Transcript_60808/m.123316 type:complete len:164 (-) Transcript_60808:73-564(-)